MVLFSARGARGWDYARPVSLLRKFAVIALATLAIASLAALALASGGGSALGDAGQGQYGTKPDCRPQSSQYSPECPGSYTTRRHQH
jgi:hypothetical protein